MNLSTHLWRAAATTCGIRTMIIVACCACLTVGGPVFADTPAPGASLICNVTIVDVEKGALLPGQSVVIRGEKIAKIAPAAEVEAPQDAPVIDGNGLFLVPGLFDAHVHYIDPESFGKLFIAYGVTFTRDMGGYTDGILSMRDQLNRGELLGPELVATGAIIDGKPPVWPFSEVCETADEGRAAVRKLAERGVNQIKVYSLLKPEPYAAILDETRKVGLKAVGHVPEAVGLEEAMKAGQASSEHMTGFPNLIAKLVDPTASQPAGFRSSFRGWMSYAKLDKDVWRGFLAKLRASGMVVCPTLVVMKGIAGMNEPETKNHPELRYVPTSLQAFWGGGRYGDFSKGAKAALPAMVSTVGDLHRAGVTLICGTDLANPHVYAGYSLHDEMAMFQEAGVPAADALRAATIVPAKFMGVDDRHGRVAEGKTASLVLLRANPLDDIRNTQRIAGVFLKGRYFDRAALDGLLNEVADRVAVTQPAAAAPAAKLELPGKEIARGRYVSKFNGMDAGDEEFVITQDEEGYHVKAQNRPKSFSLPSLTTIHVAPDFAFRKAEWVQQSQTPLTAEYRLAGDEFVAEARRGDEAPQTQTLPRPVAPLVSGPAYAGEFVSLGAAALKVGETKSFDAVGFGYPGWQLSVSKLTLTRKDDAELTLGGKRVRARYYTSVLDIPVGQFIGETWTDERGVTLKSVTKMAFGTISYELETTGATPAGGGWWSGHRCTDW